MCRRRGNAGPVVIRKRSYRRALRRLGAVGLAKYRGKTIHSRQNLTFVGSEQRGSSARSRIKYAVWNCGGLSEQLHAEILCWAGQEGVDVLLLQETHWSQAMEWQDANWCYVHSAAAKPRTGGVMAVFARKSLDVGTCAGARWCRADYCTYGVS